MSEGMFSYQMSLPFVIAKNASHQSWLNVGSGNHLDNELVELRIKAGYGDSTPGIPSLGGRGKRIKNSTPASAML